MFSYAACRQYTKAMKGIRKLLLVRTSRTPDGLLYVAEKRRGSAAQEPKMDHLVCFLPGEIFPILMFISHTHNSLHLPFQAEDGRQIKLQLARLLVLVKSLVLASCCPSVEPANKGCHANM